VVCAAFQSAAVPGPHARYHEPNLCLIRHAPDIASSRYLIPLQT